MTSPFLVAASAALWAAAADAPVDAAPVASVAEAPRAIERRVTRVAVGDFAVTDVDAQIARVVAESLVHELRKLERTNVISFEEVRQMLNLEAEKQTLGCESDSSCLAQIADALGVDFLITGTLAKVGDNHVFGLRLLNQASASAELGVNKVMPAGNGVELLAEIGPAVEALLPQVPLKAGQTRGISPEQARRLTPPPLSPWLFAGAAVTSGVLLLGSGGAAVLQVIYQAEYKATAARAKTRVESGAALVAAGNNAQAAELTAWSLLAAGLLATGLTAAMVPLTDFEGIAEAAP
jgi:TolB-like protein